MGSIDTLRTRPSIFLRTSAAPQGVLRISLFKACRRTHMERCYVHARRSAVTQITVRAKRGRLESRLLLTLIHIDHLP